MHNTTADPNQQQLNITKHKNKQRTRTTTQKHMFCNGNTETVARDTQTNNTKQTQKHTPIHIEHTSRTTQHQSNQEHITT